MKRHSRSTHSRSTHRSNIPVPIESRESRAASRARASRTKINNNSKNISNTHIGHFINTEGTQGSPNNLEAHINKFKNEVKPLHHTAKYRRNQVNKALGIHKLLTVNESNLTNSTKTSACEYNKRLDVQSKLIDAHEKLIKKLDIKFDKIIELYNGRAKTNNQTRKTPSKSSQNSS